jgi:hypothetical protein
MQLYLQKGNYGNRYSEKHSVTLILVIFALKVIEGVGFDKPQLGDKGPTCGCASMTSFGHTGFTGTMAWADPETEIVYIFYRIEHFQEILQINYQEKIFEKIFRLSFMII